MSTSTSSGINVRSSSVPTSKTCSVHKIKPILKFCILCFVIAVVWLMFMLPTVFYHLSQKVSKWHASIFSKSLHICSISQGTSVGLATVDNGSGVVNTSTIICSQRFSLSPQSGMCLPVCGEWEEFSHEVVLAFNIFTALFYIFHLIGTGIALAFSCYNYRIM